MHATIQKPIEEIVNIMPLGWSDIVPDILEQAEIRINSN